ncbi:ATP-binding protein [Planobispora longispora]|uniref:ATP-binding protein n=1 Tax=Planobispora longispora TaxID=28887 RepID=UPI0023B277F4|nr:ATP-binding protein [Planobispora longispora]BFE77771.1 hypothetical protein GCM10020093_003720 [Planobispora longispora]
MGDRLSRDGHSRSGPSGEASRSPGLSRSTTASRCERSGRCLWPWPRPTAKADWAADGPCSSFQRLRGTGTYQSVGMGLSLVQRIITRHSGRIWVESTPEGGTTFFFTLPTA